jgi:hypothetical protein
MSKSKFEISLSPAAPGDDHPIACGLHFKRAAVDWAASPKIIGVQRKDNLQTDMAGQTGIYHLLSGSELIHVGSAIDRDLGTCLSEHTRDEFSSKWDHFNFIGFREVRSDGTLGQEPTQIASKRLICLQVAMIALASPGCEFSKRAIVDAKLTKFKQGLAK